VAVKIDENVLRGRWLHSHEEDEPGQRVFRSELHELPPARGRSGYVFDAGGRVQKIGSGPTDRSAASSGHWSADSTGRLTIQVPGQPEEVLEVVSVDKDRLVVRS
jgi:hypothetical protein